MCIDAIDFDDAVDVLGRRAAVRIVVMVLLWLGVLLMTIIACRSHDASLLDGHFKRTAARTMLALRLVMIVSTVVLVIVGGATGASCAMLEPYWALGLVPLACEGAVQAMAWRNHVLYQSHPAPCRPTYFGARPWLAALISIVG